METGFPAIRKINRPGIYVHYPFCVHKCSYCDFFSEGIGLAPSPLEGELFAKYKEEFLTRIGKFPDHKNMTFDTVFFGGGTPSKASPERYADFIKFLKENIQLSENSEITLECNPEDISPEYLRGLHDAGVNRIHVGIQSFLPKNLKFLDRYYDPETYPRILEALTSSPIQNFGADLMFGVPKQTEEEFYSDAEEVLKAGVSHISIYALTVEKGTEYSRKVSAGTVPPPTEEVQENILMHLPDFLADRGFLQYEVSNYSKPGLYSRHNMKYWTYEYYLGIGPGAHGFLPSGRYSNPRNTNTYLRKIQYDPYEKPDIFEELLVSLFRIFMPVDLSGFLDLIPDQKDRILCKLKVKASEGKCSLDGNIFQWNKEAVLFLDSEILDLAQTE
ncbi:radical SAM family heme chaperone HemW [Leptospira langatensis]|uniref:Heme chaperone HemW n=1 Tax=Leptospira langatensis TaxID=2484983 RepID=A0A5F1ZRA9_9LEPT|nr:radical SAM family heme chaperone HemW [Leptospira langatensis]TGK05480.1 radical SAM family heme chaperone HemW [Leptospira langatensis]TGL38616.1 radical SAM family heme chaperone HemW [Leptospira langatensis]